MKLSTDRIVSLSAMVVGVSSLLITLYQTKLMRESARAAVLPYLMVGLNSDNEGVFVTLRNAGIGPALIDKVAVRAKGREIPGDAYEYYVTTRSGAVMDPHLSMDRIQAGRLIPAGENIKMLGSWGSANREAMLGELLHMFNLADVPRVWLENIGATEPDKAVVEISYASVYGDHWIARSNSTIPEPR
jgi:hypothetical protein